MTIFAFLIDSSGCSVECIEKVLSKTVEEGVPMEWRELDGRNDTSRNNTWRRRIECGKWGQKEARKHPSFWLGQRDGRCYHTPEREILGGKTGVGARNPFTSGTLLS